MTALEIINAIRDRGAQMRHDRQTGDVFVIGDIPAELLDELARRRDDVLAVLQEHATNRIISATDLVNRAEGLLRPLTAQ